MFELFEMFSKKLGSLSELIIIPCTFLAFKYLYDYYVALSKKYHERLMFKQRHNCVVMYRNNIITGWPPFKERMKGNISKDCLVALYEPLLYFINTAQHSIDVAVMIINLPHITNALNDACLRGIKIRVLINFHHTESSKKLINELIKNGIEVVPFISSSDNMSSIMHFKYMVKDFEKGNGYSFMGSMNLSNNAFFNNYEDLVFTCSKDVVTALHENFQLCWDYVKNENKTIMNKVILSDADLL